MDVTVRRHPERGRYDRETVYSVIDEALICHVGVVRDGAAVVLPTIHARLGDVVYLHGSPAAGMLRDGRKGVPMCVSFTLVDELVMPRSARNHSMNYRSAVVFGDGRRVTDWDEKWAALEAVTNKVVPGRWDEVRRPDDAEMREVEVIAVDIVEGSVSAKVRTGPPTVDETGGAVGAWAGVVPLTRGYGTPVPAVFVDPGAPPPSF